nr:immunoglobulin heavy chain junction region [Macaca mulatta]MOW23528.1 immunoglobulin heavy chain junction region [Macaca mulatta]MOW23900.1 immunoglobulin heavy chain junction region [Macaca mulatta]MOW24820.1 immunoglobulin heavy chain junction region [Macaca mulatta]MOW24874.1 immunoglobulin heavy chain junction region [Macaca mulatta]
CARGLGVILVYFTYW